MIGTTLLNRYQIVSEMGRGGMGVVYRAQDMLLQRAVAVKVLPAADLDDERTALLQFEARAAAKLNHPNIVGVYDVGDANGLPFIVMELVEGLTLRVYQGLPLSQVLNIARQICAALEHAHAHGIIHRDLKLDNVLLTKTQIVKLTDFGLARVLGQTRTTAEGTIEGTFEYLAPELISGGHSSVQSDLYAFGVLLYELATDRPPFDRSDLTKLLRDQLSTPVTPPAVHNPGIPAVLDELIVRLMSKSPGERPESATEVARVLQVASHRATTKATLPTLTVPRAQHNLPTLYSKFIGREKEVAQIVETLRSSRLVTLAGTGGIGKTRLVIRAAREMLTDFPNGVWFVGLASLADPSLVPQSVTTVLGMRDEIGRTQVDALVDYLRDKKLLLVLDNCEHLVEACAQLAGSLLQAAPDLRILATSREALNIEGETTYRVPSLTLPQPEGLLPLESLTEYEAIRLFVERASVALPSFRLSQTNAPALVKICQQLDGIPLAIELAASRVKTLQVDQIADRLDDVFRLLTGGNRAALPRQQTLRALIDWSYNLLTDPERMLLRRVSVFAGGWTLEAAEAVCSSRNLEIGSVFDLLAQLANKSLIIVERELGQETRYRILETLRQYGRVRLLEANEDERMRRKHLVYFRRWVSEVEPKLHSFDQLRWLNLLEREHNNVRTAIEWSLQTDETESGLRLTSGLYYFWFIRGYHNEAHDRLQAALARPEAARRTAARAKALNSLGYIDGVMGQYVEGLTIVQEALSISRDLNDKLSMAVSLRYLGFLHGSLRNFPEASAALAEGLALWRELDDKHGLGWTLIYVGDMAMVQDNFVQARAAYEESVSLLRDSGNKNMLAYPVRRLAYVALHLGEIEKSETLATESLKLNLAVGDHWGVPACLATLAVIAAAQNDHRKAARLYGAATAQLELLNTRLLLADQVESEPYRLKIREALGDEEFDQALAEGRAMTVEQAIEAGSPLTST